MRIEDGTGAGYTAKVDGNKRVHTQSTTETESLHSAEIGDAYNVSSGDISFTADGTLLYIKNLEDQDLIVEAIALGNDGGGTYTSSLRPSIEIVRNPTAGDLITDATAVDYNVNRNFGSSKTLTSNSYKGKSGGTITGGANLGKFQTSTAGRDFFAINMVLPKGSSIAVRVINGLASGTVVMYCAAVIFLKDERSND